MKLTRDTIKADFSEFRSTACNLADYAGLETEKGKRCSFTDVMAIAYTLFLWLRFKHPYNEDQNEE